MPQCGVNQRVGSHALLINRANSEPQVAENRHLPIGITLPTVYTLLQRHVIAPSVCIIGLLAAVSNQAARLSRRANCIPCFRFESPDDAIVAEQVRRRTNEN